MSFADEAHLLIVEPEDELRRLLMKYLGRQGFWVTGARSGDHARRLTEGLSFDLAVVDAGLEDDDLRGLVRTLGREGRVPVVVLHAAGADPSELAAAGTLAKPFEPAVLLERINALLRLTPETAEPPRRELRLGPLHYDVEHGELRHGDRPVRLTATESLLMRIFAAHPGETFSRAKLVEQLGRGDGQAQERAIDVQITRLRRKIEPDPKAPRYLQTVRGAGYVLSPDG